MVHFTEINLYPSYHGISHYQVIKRKQTRGIYHKLALTSFSINQYILLFQYFKWCFRNYKDFLYKSKLFQLLKTHIAFIIFHFNSR